MKIYDKANLNGGTAKTAVEPSKNAHSDNGTRTAVIRKLTSRKFITALITAIVGIITLFIGQNETVAIIAGAAMTILPTLTYCIIEGVIDARHLKSMTDTALDTAAKLGADTEKLDNARLAADSIITAVDALSDEEKDTSK